MHFEILVEDRSGREALDVLVPKLLTAQHTFNIHPYKGIGHLPKNLHTLQDPKKRLLLAQLPRLLRGYGQTFAGYPPGYKAAVISICDLDNRCRHEFRLELLALLADCVPQPETRFCIATEEMEAWLLGDAAAVRAAYPFARNSVLESYIQDSICGTWEVLADAVHQGGAKTLRIVGYPEIGAAKSAWARAIAPFIDIETNSSPSFQYLRSTIEELSNEGRVARTAQV